jgi:putative endonuclease
LGNQRGTLYVGFTNNLHQRMAQHKSRKFPGFTAKYGVSRLLYFEEFDRIEDALEAEHVIKGWRRSKKLDLIRTTNPKFADLSEELS